MESAAFLADKVKSVTILGKDSVPFENILGKNIGEQIANLFKSKGVHLIMNGKVEKFIGENGKLKHIVADGKSILADPIIAKFADLVFEGKTLSLIEAEDDKWFHELL